MSELKASDTDNTTHTPSTEISSRHATTSAGDRSWTRTLKPLRFGNIGAVYVGLIIAVYFSVTQPDLFPRLTTLQLILNQNSVAALVAFSLIVPMCTRVFDLSIGYVMGMTSVTAAYLVVERQLSFTVTIVLCLLLALAAGLLNVVLVVMLGIDSFIATLASGAFFQAIILLISGNVPVTDQRLNQDFGKIANTEIIFGLTPPVFVAIVIGLLIWWLLERTVTGRRLYATGFNEEAARLVGVQTRRLRVGGLLVSALVAGLAGILVTAQVGAGSPEIGPGYLLTSFAAVFLGATQFRGGRFNVQGAAVAVLVIAVGSAGLAISGAPVWGSSMFLGIILLSSLALRRYEEVRSRTRNA